MSETTSQINGSQAPSQERRDFLLIATSTVAATGAALASWPLIDNMNPSDDVLALSSIEVDLGPVVRGQRITVIWRKQPVFIDYRTEREIKRAKADDSATLIDPEPDRARVKREEWLVVIGVCTHLGCIPLGQKPSQPRGSHGGWFCACHGSLYDTSGRVRRGPAPKNLYIPPYTFLNEKKIRIG